MRIVKVKVTKDPKKVLVNFQQLNRKHEYDDFSICSSDDPAPAFDQAITKLRQHVLDLCEIGGAYDLPRVTVTGVSCSYTPNSQGGADIFGASIIAQWALEESNGSLNLVTPHKFESYTSGGDTGDPKQLLDNQCLADLYALLAAAEDYVSGIRAQLALPLETPVASDTITFDGQSITLERFLKAADLTNKLTSMADAELMSLSAYAAQHQQAKFASIILCELHRRHLVPADVQGA